MRTFGERVDGYDENKWAKYELGGSIAIKGDIRTEILKSIEKIRINTIS